MVNCDLQHASMKVGNLIPNTFFITKGSGESDLEKHA